MERVVRQFPRRGRSDCVQINLIEGAPITYAGMMGFKGSGTQVSLPPRTLRTTFVSIFGIGFALDWYVQMNAARISIQRVVLFSSSGHTIQVCLRSHNGPKLPFLPQIETGWAYPVPCMKKPRILPLHDVLQSTESCPLSPSKKCRILPILSANNSVVAISQYHHNPNVLIEQLRN